MLLQLTLAGLAAVGTEGDGCQAAIERWCPVAYNKGHVKNVPACLACVKVEWTKLQANCSTMDKADGKCGTSPPTPPAPGPPLPPTPPLPPPSPDDPLPVHEVVQQLGVGLDASWTKFGSEINSFTKQWPLDMRSRGFRSVRIRAATDTWAEFVAETDGIYMIRESLAAGLVAVLAYQHPDLHTVMNEATRLKTVAWWRDAANALRNDSHSLVFNTFIEVHPNNTLPYPPLFNAWTADIATAVRETNPTRVLILAPPGPDVTNLANLTVPADCGEYCMAEWHDWAGGPRYSNQDAWKVWTGNGTAESKEAIRAHIDIATNWSAAPGGLPTWVGAWTPGVPGFPDKCNYTIAESTAFATFVGGELRARNIPGSVNAFQHFYNATSNSWMSDVTPIVDALLGA